MLRELTTMIAAIAMALALALPASAQDKPAAGKDAPKKEGAGAKGAKGGAKAAKAAKEPAGGGQKVLRLEAIKVEGKIQKPQAYYFLPRSNLNIEGLELNESFVPKIVKSVEEEPF
ncbi:MAG: hypothetical protein HY897_22810 [Deltaproteobacteria bacterium]|nr:hypothetical protein [Deltaproteobacteria bacterium]